MKTTVKGKNTREKMIYLIRPFVGEEEFEAVKKVFELDQNI